MVEETISLFKQGDSGAAPIPRKRIIQVKSQDFFEVKRSTTDPVTSEQEKLKVIQDQIEKAKEQFEKIQQNQKELVQLAKKEIEQERVNWNHEKEVWIEQAKEEGFNKGYSDGQAEAVQQYQGSLQQINDIVNRATKDYHALIAKNDETIVDLAIYVAEKIVKQKISDDPSHFLNIVKAAIKELQDQTVITIYLHPKNYAFVMDHKQELSKLLEDNMKLSIYVKDFESENACIIEHPFGQIDTSVDTQLNQIRQMLQDVVQENFNE